MSVDLLLARLLVLLGVGFLVANLRVVTQLVRYERLRRSAVLTWPGRRPPYLGFVLLLAMVLAGLVIVKLWFQERPPIDAFGESMMMLYYGVAVPLSQRIGRGFYATGVWTDAGFMPYDTIGGLTWRDGAPVTLVLIDRRRQWARRLVVPDRHLGEVRRVLRDRIAVHDIRFAGEGLDLGERDERDVV